jgi:hypothetical protein
VTRRRSLCFSAVIVLAALLWLPVTPAQARRIVVGPGAISMTIRDVEPNSPEPAKHPKHLDVSLVLTNNTAHNLPLTITATRGNPIFTQPELHSAIAKENPPSSDQAAPLKPRQVTLLPNPDGNQSTDEVFDITTSPHAPDADLCLCANAIYPLYFTALYTPPGGRPLQLATAQTYIPSFPKQPVKAQVGWVWPLLDRPHRLLSGRLFVDDELAAEVAPGGRLDQLLSVVEKVGRQVPMTIVTDPELIDELAVMSQHYNVRSPSGPVRGQGGPAAASWLARLRAVLAMPGMEVSFTPYADPPVETLQRAALDWTVGLPSQQQNDRVTRALGDLPSNDIAWPANETISMPTLTTLVSQGTSTVVVDDKTLPKGRDSTVVPTALAPLETTRGSATAAVTSSLLERWVQTVLAPDGPGLSALPELVAQLALRVELSVAAGDTESHYIVLTPPRDVSTVDPNIAARMILDTARTTWSSPLPLRAAASTLQAVDHGSLQPRNPPRIATRVITRLRYVLGSIAGLGSLFSNETVAQRLRTELPIATLRTESTELLAVPGLTHTYSTSLAHYVRRLRNRVVLVPPLKGGNYTLASKNSKLPVTITNRLGADVKVVIGMTGAVGFSADPVSKTVPANSTVQVRVPTHVDRVGLFYVQVTLSTPDGLLLSSPLQLTVHSTALGTIGIVITVVAAIVLLAALLIRFIRRMRHRGAPDAPVSTEPVSAATAAP